MFLPQKQQGIEKSGKKLNWS